MLKVTKIIQYVMVQSLHYAPEDSPLPKHHQYIIFLNSFHLRTKRVGVREHTELF